MAKKLNVTDLDFDQIRTNLKNYFTRAGSPFQDWDFDGSSLSILLDVLAYNTHYNAMLAHMTLNEGFVDTAQLRESVVSHAKLLGYTPASRRAARSTLSVTFNSSPKGTANLTLARGAKFSAVYNGTQYSFVNLESSTVKKNSNSTYTFSGLEVAQGILARVSFLVDASKPSQRFVLTDKNIDISTLKVFVRENASSTSIQRYIPFTTLYETQADTPVYFLAENYQGNYELSFGDGIYGKALENLQVVEAEYVTTDGSEANGSSSFSYISGVLNTEAILDGPTVTGIAASGGSERENIESVRFNAPLSFVSQNRAVTANDYIALIQKEFGAVDAINVWGGEDQDPITPSGAGKVYISIKPQGSDTLDDNQKSKILNILDGKRVMTLKTKFEDPDYTYLTLNTSFKYNDSVSSLTRKELENLVLEGLSSFNDSYLQKFNGVFRYSNFLNYIDRLDPAILNSYARVSFFKNYDHKKSTTLDITESIADITTDGTNVSVRLFEDFDLLSGWTVNFYNGSTGVIENKAITIEDNFVFSYLGSSVPTGYDKVLISRASSLHPSLISFSNGIAGRQDEDSQYTPLLESSSWTFRYDSSTKLPVVSGGTSNTVYLRDEPIYDSQKATTWNKRLLALYTTGGSRLATVGTMDLATGILSLSQPIVNPTSTTVVTITTVPDSDDLAPKRNQLLKIDMASASVDGEVDTIVSGGSAGGITYNTFKR